jgi:hypothetical protein
MSIAAAFDSVGVLINIGVGSLSDVHFNRSCHDNVYKTHHTHINQHAHIDSKKTDTFLRNKLPPEAVAIDFSAHFTIRPLSSRVSA